MTTRAITAVLLLSGLLALAASLGGVHAQPKDSPQVPAPSARQTPDSQQAEQGKYLVELGDCVACHTERGGQRFAGGRPLETPFGTVLSANLTPDDETGIGRYTPETFYRALHEGIDRDGRHLYPAFPYNYYTQVTREDSDAMLAYLRTLAPVHKPLERNQLPFPFNIRSLMVVWNWLFLDQGPFRPDPARSAELNRGAYLVQGLGHCAACHTPKNFMGGPKRGQAFQGGVFGNWYAPDITANKRVGIGGWDDDALREFLHRGLNVHSAASAEMGEVVAFSTSQMSDADLHAVVAWLRQLPASPEPDPAMPDPAVMRRGLAIWQDSCSACHAPDGRGVPRYFPPLRGNPNLQQREPTTVLHFILAGTQRTPTSAAPTALSMPAFYWKLDDAQVAAVATFARNSWGNAGGPVTAEQVAALRGKLQLHRGGEDRGAPTDLQHPNPRTLAPAGTSTHDNGTPQAGRPAAAASAAPASAAAPSAASSEASSVASSAASSASMATAVPR